MNKQKIYVSNAEDRLMIAGILFKNGYSVRLGKEKNAQKVIYCVEYWKEA